MDEARTILIVDDEPDNVDLVDQHLRRIGYITQLAYSGEEALELFERQRPDCVLLDVMMPRMNGFEVCQRIKAATGASDYVPVMMVTVLDDIDSIVEGLERSGADDYLTKPFKARELIARVSTLIRSKVYWDRLQAAHQELVRKDLYLERMLDPLWILDEAGLTVEVNPAFCRLVGRERDAVLERPAEAFFGDEDRGRLEAALRALRGGDRPEPMELYVIDSDGQPLPALASLSPILQNRKMLGTIVVLRDLREKRALEEAVAEREAQLKSLEEQLEAFHLTKRIVGTSRPLRQSLEITRQAAASSASALLVGESGTGKELFAHAFHRWSERAEGPFVTVACAALPDALLEAELFGSEEGAEAAGRKTGRIEQADGGTLFLDEIGETSPAVQVKLLRLLQEGEFEPLGATEARTVDVRLVASTTKELAAEVEAGRFREDLYYRLSVITIPLVPLRERKEDIPLLIDHFLKLYNEKNHKAVQGLAKKASYALADYSWPGNIQELENTVERAVVLCRGDLITEEDLPEEVRLEGEEKKKLVIPMGATLEEIEKRVIVETLKHYRGNKQAAARALGIAARTIYRKLGQDKD
ncbi:MAG: sigma-54-dependent Fis family transcriptional regulator [Nitrospinae bacterium]|nr:sigma-54-dependent Fis family transcriptional regulator [Nitrospinota bacterium]